MPKALEWMSKNKKIIFSGDSARLAATRNVSAEKQEGKQPPEYRKLSAFMFSRSTART
jgi:hypothetical protein